MIIKPASDTPLSALEARGNPAGGRAPPEAIACLTGSGGSLGEAICADHRVRKMSFTGSYEVGEQICQVRRHEKGDDGTGQQQPGDRHGRRRPGAAAEAMARRGFANAGQVCISAQRILTSKKIRGLVSSTCSSRRSRRLTVGEPAGRRDEDGPARPRGRREPAWSRGSRKRSPAARSSSPAAADAARCTSRRFSTRSIRRCGSASDELFGPAVAVTPFTDIDEAIRLANDTRYGLVGGHLHAGYRPRDEVRPRSRQRQPAHQLVHAMAGRPHAVRRISRTAAWARRGRSMRFAK